MERGAYVTDGRCLYEVVHVGPVHILVEDVCDGARRHVARGWLREVIPEPDLEVLEDGRASAT